MAACKLLRVMARFPRCRSLGISENDDATSLLASICRGIGRRACIDQSRARANGNACVHEAHGCADAAATCTIDRIRDACERRCADATRAAIGCACSARGR